MKRVRGADNARLRRTLKNRSSRLGETMCSGGLVYGKLFLAWIAFISADFLIGFRFELLWPFWLLLRSVYDSFHYQGLAFSVFFVCVTATSDLVCFLFIPVQLLLFLASTYVWMQYVWHAGSDRGLCTPTIMLWFLLMVVEYGWRLRDGRWSGHLNNAPLSFAVDLCRPFAAHCIGYPVVTLGFGIKSYLGGWRLQRRQREIAKDNEVYGRILTEALPSVWEPRPFAAPSPVSSADGEMEVGELYSTTPLAICANGGATIRKSSRGLTSGLTASSSSSSWRNGNRSLPPGVVNGTVNRSTQNERGGGWISRVLGSVLPSWGWSNGPIDSSDLISSRSSSGRASDDEDDNSSLADDLGTIRSNGARPMRGAGRGRTGGTGQRVPPVKPSSTRNATRSHGLESTPLLVTTPGLPSIASPLVSSLSSTNNLLCQNNNNSIHSNGSAVVSKSEPKESVKESLELDNEKLRSELRSARCVESELRTQMTQMSTADRQIRQELQQTRAKYDQSETKLQNALRAREQDKASIQTLEKRLVEAQKQRSDLEKELSSERKTKQRDEAAAARALANAVKTECGDACRVRRREMEAELKSSRKDLRVREEQLTQLEDQLVKARSLSDNNSSEVLKSAMASLRDKNEHLEHSLSAENRLKQDLFRALGDAKSRMEALQNELSTKDVELKRHRSELAQLRGEGLSAPLVPPLTPSPPLLPVNDSNMQMLTSALANVAAASYRSQQQQQQSFGTFNGTELAFDPATGFSPTIPNSRSAS